MRRISKIGYGVPEPNTGIRIWVWYIRKKVPISFDITVTPVPSPLGPGEIMVNNCLTLGVTLHALWPLADCFSILLKHVA